MGIIYGKFLMPGGKKPSQLNVTTNGTWSKSEGYSPVNVNVPASAVTSGTKVITANGVYDVTEFKNVRVTIFEDSVRTSPIDGLSYADGLPINWIILKEVAKMISEASERINSNTTGSIYVNKGSDWAYKITPGNTLNIPSQMGTYTYAVMGFNNFALTYQTNYGGNHTTAGLTFGAVNCVGEDLKKYPMNSSDTNSGGWGNCLMRTSTMPTLKEGMSAPFAQVKVPYVNYNQSTVLYSDDYLFLPAEKEVFGDCTYSPTAEANALTQFAYYKNGGSKIKSLPGSTSANKWWLRSVRQNDNSRFCAVWSTGANDYGQATFSRGASPCFCV